MPIPLIVAGAAAASSAAGYSLSTLLASIFGATLGGLGIGGGAVGLAQNMRESNKTPNPEVSSTTLSAVQAAVKQLPDEIKKQNKKVKKAINHCENVTLASAQQKKELKESILPKVEKAITKAKQVKKDLKTTTLNALKKAMNETKKAKSQAKTLEKKLKAKEGIFKTLVKQLKENNQAMQAAQKNDKATHADALEKLSVENAELHQVINRLQADLKTAKATYKKLTQHVLLFEKKYAELQEQFKQIQMSHEDLSCQSLRLEDQNAALTQQVKAYKTNERFLKEKITELKLGYSQANALIAKSTHAYQSLESNFAQLLTENGKLKQINAEQKQVIDRLKPQVARALVSLSIYNRHLKDNMTGSETSAASHINGLSNN